MDACPWSQCWAGGRPSQFACPIPCRIGRCCSAEWAPLILLTLFAVMDIVGRTCTMYAPLTVRARDRTSVRISAVGKNCVIILFL